MIIHKNIKSWLDQFKPGVEFSRVSMLNEKIEHHICTDYPVRMNSISQHWTVKTEKEGVCIFTLGIDDYNWRIKIEKNA